MTTTDVLLHGFSADEPPFRPTDSAATMRALREVIFGEYGELHRSVRDVIVELADTPRSGATYSQQTQDAPELLRAVIAGLGRPAREIAADTQLRGALCDWAQIAAPRLLLVLTGHFDLVIGAILGLGNDSPYQRECLAELDSGAALGVLMLTELGGTNGADQQTTATWDAETGGFWLTTPSAAATKFMPNVAEASAPKTVVVTARLLLDGKDEGVLPFLLKLRTSTGLADGVDVVALPDKASAPMDHAMIRFRRVWVPREALLGGDWARLSPEGLLECELPPRRRFHTAITMLGNGRLDLANAAVASARAALAGLANYTRQRRPGSGTLMADRSAVQLGMVSALAAVYATSVLGRRIRDMRAESTTVDPEQAIWSMLAKPLLSNTARQVLTMCRQRAAAQGALRINYLVDWIGNLEAIITAEGENQIMQITAGKSIINLPALRLPGTPAQMPWYIEMLADRETTLALELRSSTNESTGIGPGADWRAIELATATAERLAATALLIAALGTEDPAAGEMAASAAAAYSLQHIYDRGAWYTEHLRMTPDLAVKVSGELHHHQTVLSAHLPAMVTAFDIPELPGPIFSPDYIQAWLNYADWDDTTFAADDPIQ
ncbi:acyl-CoA dehydrogenase family protein [Nocardia sp. NPDC006630]|uniref:acyl-CoA dehydrogenase family protein n=1 Tax=Nocardia sp. NPDC006630 TaxID=3157181 RepID=UPI0033B7BAB5